MKGFFAWCIIITITATMAMQMEFANLMEQIEDYKAVHKTRELTIQEQGDLYELLIRLNYLRNELVLIGNKKK